VIGMLCGNRRSGPAESYHGRWWPSGARSRQSGALRPCGGRLREHARSG
jgi:hypothetical protein